MSDEQKKNGASGDPGFSVAIPESLLDEAVKAVDRRVAEAHAPHEKSGVPPLGEGLPEPPEEISVAVEMENTVAEAGSPDEMTIDELLLSGHLPDRVVVAFGELRAKLAETEKTATAVKERLTNTLAENENFRRRLTREKTDAIKFANEGVVKEILPVVDNLERALSHAEGAATVGGVREGVEITLRQFQNVLQKLGVTKVSAEPGTPFDPHLHQGVAQHERADLPPNTIALCMQPGYALFERLLRPAMVAVVKAPAPVTVASEASPVPRGSGPVTVASEASPVPRGSGPVTVATAPAKPATPQATQVAAATPAAATPAVGTPAASAPDDEDRLTRIREVGKAARAAREARRLARESEHVEAARASGGGEAARAAAAEEADKEVRALSRLERMRNASTAMREARQARRAEAELAEAAEASEATVLEGADDPAEQKRLEDKLERIRRAGAAARAARQARREATPESAVNGEVPAAAVAAAAAPAPATSEADLQEKLERIRRAGAAARAARQARREGAEPVTAAAAPATPATSATASAATAPAAAKPAAAAPAKTDKSGAPKPSFEDDDLDSWESTVDAMRTDTSKDRGA